PAPSSRASRRSPRWRRPYLRRRRVVRVPASSANLGPGFDVMGAALDLHMELEVAETGRFAVHTDLAIATDRRNLAVRGFEALLVVPEQHVRTARARAALPASVPISDAVFNVAHASMLVLGLARGDLGLVARGLGDRLHQPPRAHLYPRSSALIERSRALG